MKTSRIIWGAFAIGLGALAGAMFNSRSRPPQLQPPIVIQDGKTIDFSSGKPVVKDSTKEKAIIDAAVKEMEAASQNVTFAPTAEAAKK